MTAMDITIHASFLPHTDPDASLAFYRDTLGFEIRNDVGYGGMRWITVGPVGQPSTANRTCSKRLLMKRSLRLVMVKMPSRP